jgi:hypothetical protein
MAMEARPKLATATLDASNAFGEIERDRIEVAIKANPYPHGLLPLFNMLYMKGAGDRALVLYMYDEAENFVMGTRNKRGFRQGCIMGFFLFCLTMEPVCARLRAVLGEEGTLFNYCDDSYLLAEPNKMAEVLEQALRIFGRVGLCIGFGPRKSELILPKYYDMKRFPYPHDSPGTHAPCVVRGFVACLGVPRHFTNDQELITSALGNMGEKHDRLLDLVKEVYEEDPFAVLKLLQVCGVIRFCHILNEFPL